MKRAVTENSLAMIDEKGNVVAELKEQKREDLWLVHLNGSVGNDCSYDIEDELFALVSLGYGLILDMSETTYVSDTFAKVLIRLQIRMENSDYESMPIQNMPSTVYQALKERGYIASLDYELKEE